MLCKVFKMELAERERKDQSANHSRASDDLSHKYQIIALRRVLVWEYEARPHNWNTFPLNSVQQILTVLVSPKQKNAHHRDTKWNSPLTINLPRKLRQTSTAPQGFQLQSTETWSYKVTTTRLLIYSQEGENCLWDLNVSWLIGSGVCHRNTCHTLHTEWRTDEWSGHRWAERPGDGTAAGEVGWNDMRVWEDMEMGKNRQQGWLLHRELEMRESGIPNRPLFTYSRPFCVMVGTETSIIYLNILFVD